VKDFHCKSAITIVDYRLTNDVVLTTKVMYHLFERRDDSDECPMIDKNWVGRHRD
jgi:hypothetical protein